MQLSLTGQLLRKRSWEAPFSSVKIMYLKGRTRFTQCGGTLKTRENICTPRIYTGQSRLAISWRVTITHTDCQRMSSRGNTIRKSKKHSGRSGFLYDEISLDNAP